MIRLIFTDVDGTLVGSSGRAHPATWDAAERARSAGIAVAVCSGRPGFGLSREYAERLTPEGWHSFQNGASVVHLGSGESLSTPMRSEIVDMLIERARASGRILELYSDDDLAVELDSPRTRAHAELLGVPFRSQPFDALVGPIVRAQWLATLGDREAILAEGHLGLEVNPSTSPVMPDTLFVNMTPAGIDKGTSVAAIAKATGIAPSAMMFVGDGWNDLAAMHRVGYPVAMGNAEAELHEIAWRVVGDVDAGGLAEAIDLAIAVNRAGEWR